jgi:head-tail adaptor
MGRLPGFLLRHRVTVAPYLGVWGLYSAPVPDLPCLVQERIASAAGQAGVSRLLMFTVVAPLTWQIRPVEGSLLTLPDGRTSFISAVATHTAPGLPVPEHYEIAVELGATPLPPALGGELVVILRRLRVGEDRYGNPRYATAEDEIPGAAVRPLSSQERTGTANVQARDQTIDTIEVVFPPGTEITSNDRLRVRGLTYEVDGTPTDLRDSMTGADPGIKVIGKRVKG